ncbi:MAG: peptide chain release factor N(5)-glutamine methyltransferase [Pasteurellaceae bacterium]|nr:peptide chain release factor N(5)-glutamine methyltransferase [Pasteurellaceae bacterium]
MSLTYQQWLQFAQQRLAQNQHKDPYLESKTDARLLLCQATGRDRASLIANEAQCLSEKELCQLDLWLERRCQGEPMAYILGKVGFWNLTLKVSADTLIPRPDTEILVEQAVQLLAEKLEKSEQSVISVLDLGTGTGAIALSIYAECQPLAQKSNKTLQVIGVDRVLGAVKLAEKNVEANQLNNVRFYQSDWFSALANQQFDLIVSNPPYIDKNDPHLQQGDVRFEPLSALVAEDQGYADLRFIVEQAPNYLKDEGYLLLEHGWQQGEKLRALFLKHGYKQVRTVQDYGANERVTMGNY